MSLERKKDIFVLMIGLLGGIRLRVMGTFYLSEIIIYLSYLFVSWYSFRSNRYVRRLIFMGALWLVGCIIADDYNPTSANNAIKGAFNIILFILQLPIAFWSLKDKPARYLHYIIGCGISSVPSFLVFGTTNIEREDPEYFLDDIWFYYSLAPLAIFIISYLYYKNAIKKLFIYILAVGFGLYMLYHNSRNVFLTMSMSAILIAYADYCYSSNISNTIKRYRHYLWVLFGSLSVGLYGIDILYEDLAENGVLGEYARTKYIQQKNSEEGLISARGDSYMGIELIIEKPIVGYGSYAKDKGDKFHQEYSIHHHTEYIPPTKERFLPGHSHLIGYWMSHGILGGLFWLYVLWLMWKVFSSGAIFIEPKMVCLFILTYMSKFWDILFSPFGNRVGMAFFLCYMVILYDIFCKMKRPSKMKLYGKKNSIF